MKRKILLIVLLLAFVGYAGWSFAELCEQLAGQGEQAPLQAAGWLKQWLSDGLLQRCASPDAEEDHGLTSG